MSNPHQETDRLLAEALPEGIVLLDQQGGLIWCNRVAACLLAIDILRHVGMPMDQLFGQPVLAKLQAEERLEVVAPQEVLARSSFARGNRVRNSMDSTTALSRRVR